MSTVLVTGGTGTTGSRVARGVTEAGVVARIASRRAAAPGQVHFDWADPATHGPALSGVEAAYLVAPVGVVDPAPLVQPFLRAAAAAGVRRLVLLSSSAVEESERPGLGDLHRRVRASGLEWAVLRPSWFMQNFTGQHAASVAAGEVVSATGSGRIGIIDAEDIAAVAVRALLDEEPHDTDLVLTGPQALDYAEIAAALSRALGHQVVHRAVTPAALGRHLTSLGVPPEWADVLAALDDDISRGEQDFTTSTVSDVTGRPPRSFADHLAEHTRGLRSQERCRPAPTGPRGAVVAPSGP
ncbi:NAD(P)H-binding protein [Kineococcus glutinatus]|uniref:NAD(P)H-binding protein n=1 Tax=Kineococcus glutinatus TaxID=1070872 RepID=A0ABP9I4X1_9ACTN